METGLAPLALLVGLHAIEQDFGRERTAGFQNGPRTLDLDILLFGDLQIREPGLEIPHPRLAERAFMLIPLNEIAAQVVVPGLARTVQQLLASLSEDLDSDAVIQVNGEDWTDDEVSK